MSKLVNCKACGKEIAKGAKKCPNCGKDNRSFFGKHKIITALLVLIIIGGAAAAAGGGAGDKTTDGSKSTNTTPAANTSTPKTKVTYDNFLKIKMGSKYEDVVILVGEGKESTSSEVAGIKSVIYTWNGAGISNMNVTVQNGVVSGKAQLGLLEGDAKVTMDKYNQVKEGMTYEQVKAILGEGQIISQTKIMNVESIMYEWINKDGSNMNGTFSGNKLQAKAQINLK